MRTGRFIKQSTGDISFESFLPSALPFDIDYSRKGLQKHLSLANMEIGRLDSLSDSVPDVDFFTFMYVRKEAVLSSRIEGTQATFSDLLQAETALRYGEVRNDVDEIVNYISAMNYGTENPEGLPVSNRLIKRIHFHLLKGVRGRDKAPGEFRKTQNWIGGSSPANASYVPPPHIEVANLMSNLEKFIHDVSEIPELIKVALVHAQFESIHPFLDGNGRIGRLLVTLYLCEKNVLRKPMLYPSEFFNSHRNDYYERLSRYHTHGEVEEWLIFFLDAVRETASHAFKLAGSIVDLKHTDEQKVKNMGRFGKNGKKLLESLFRKPLVRVKDIEKIAGIKTPNANLLAQKFIDGGILEEMTGNKRNRIFLYRDYVRLFDDKY